MLVRTPGESNAKCADELARPPGSASLAGRQVPRVSGRPTACATRATRGGYRPNAGRKKGGRWPSTLEKIAARDAVRTFVIAHLRPMLEAQLAHAQGLKDLVVRDKKTGKFLRVTEAMAKAKLAKNEEIIEVWEKDPSVQAFTDLMNRALDKPKEQEQEVKLTGSEDLIAKLHAARARMAKRRSDG